MTEQIREWKAVLEKRGGGFPGEYRFELQGSTLNYGMDGEEGIYIDDPQEAYMIAAAPRLLAALQKLHESGARARAGFSNEEEHDTAMDEALAAIKEATWEGK